MLQSSYCSTKFASVGAPDRPQRGQPVTKELRMEAAPLPREQQNQQDHGVPQGIVEQHRCAGMNERSKDAQEQPPHPEIESNPGALPGIRHRQSSSRPPWRPGPYRRAQRHTDRRIEGIDDERRVAARNHHEDHRAIEPPP